MRRQRLNRWLSACAVGVLVSACADHPPAVIEDRSVMQVEVVPEVRQSVPFEQDEAEAKAKVSLIQGPDYAVQKGDTLYSVAFRLGMDYRTLAQFNDIEPPFTILVGESLRTVPPVSPEQPTQDGAAPLPLPSDNTQRDAVLTPAALASAAGLKANESATVTSATPKPGRKMEAKPNSSAKPQRANAPVTRWRWPVSGKVSRRFANDRNKGLDLLGQRGDPVGATADGVVVYAGSGVTGYGALLIVKHNDTYLSAYGHNDELLASEGDYVTAGEAIARMGSTSADSVKLHFEIRRDGIPIDPMTLLPSR